MAKKGVRLFKLASQINVGKDRIVTLLTAKGHEIQNKPTAMLTPEMVGIVMENFHKEAELAATIDSKMEAHRRVRQDELDAEAAAESTAGATTVDGAQPAAETKVEAEAPAAEAAPEAAPEPQAAEAETTSPAVEEVQAKQADSDADAQPAAEAQEAPVQAEAESDDATVQVGTVIEIKDQDIGRGRRKRGKTKAAEAEEQAAAEETAPAKATTGKSKKAEPEEAPAEVVEAPVAAMTEEVGKPAEVSAEKETPAEEAEAAAAEAPTAEAPTAEAPTAEAQTAQAPAAEEITAAAEEDVVPEASTDDTEQADTGDDSDESGESDKGESDEAVAEDAGDDEDSEDGTGRKRKRKRKIAEIEYQAGEAPTLKGLTILGKIDLVSKSKKKDAGKKRSKTKDKEAEPGGALFAKRDKDELDPKLLATSENGGAGADDVDGKGKRRRKKGKKVKVSQEDVDKAIRKTLSASDASGASSRSKMRQRRRQERAEEQERLREQEELDQQVLAVTEFITVAELANLMDTATNEVILTCMTLGLMVSINQRLDKDTIMLIADDYGYEVEFVDELSDDSIVDEDDPEETLKPRAPIVTIMGHVDHGKTSLLDYVRETNVVAGEAGGITQHIGAYKVKVGADDREIAFLDTPGHQAFTAMRARGAQVTDIVVLIVSADDSVMPQTKEAISHARAANVPMVVAINKIDRPESNPDRIRQQLADIDVLVEDWGGKVQVAEISAKTGQNIDVLLEKILLEAEMLDVKARPDRAARGTIIESKIDKGKGPVATAIIQKGTLNVGDAFLCGVYSGRVRAMLDERGHRVDTAGPSTPVQILGFDGAPQAGDQFVGMDSESEAKQLSVKRQQIKREQAFKQIRHITLDDIASQIESGGVQDLPIILKADADGSVEALSDALQKLSTSEVRIAVIHKGVGAITESDIMLAAASNAIVIGFHIRPTPQAKRLAESEGVDIRIYRIIYDCINEIKLALEGLLRPEIKEEVSGTVEVRDVFKISKVGTIAGCYVSDGKIHRNDTVRLVRDGFDVFEGKISSLKRHKDDAKEVNQGYECGIGLENFNDIKVGDIIESIKITKIKRKLEQETEG